MEEQYEARTLNMKIQVRENYCYFNQIQVYRKTIFLYFYLYIVLIYLVYSDEKSDIKVEKKIQIFPPFHFARGCYSPLMQNSIVISLAQL